MRSYFPLTPLDFFPKFSTVVELFKELSYADFYFHKSSGFWDTAMWKLKKYDVFEVSR